MICSHTYAIPADDCILISVAATFDSPRYTADGPGLYESLRSIRTTATNEISSISRVFQDGHPIEVEVRAGDVHIGEANGTISVYVPRDKRKQNVSFASSLPTNLASWLMRDPVTHIQEEVDGAMENALTTLLIVPPSEMNVLLDRLGIIRIPIANEDIHSYDGDDQSVDSTGDDDGDDTAVVRFTPPTEDDELPIDHTVVEVVSEQVRARYGGHGSHRSSQVLPYPTHPDPDNHQYRQLLNTVVRAARSAQFPSKGSFDMSSLYRALSEDTAIQYNGFESRNRYRSTNLFERNFKIGAAGELYVSCSVRTKLRKYRLNLLQVFEILSGLRPALRGWSRQNWQSKIRDRISIHEDYAGTQSWGEPETADLVYDDIYGDLTAMLIDHGYLEGDMWRDARPYYYLEVKTTTGACGMPFYMSKSQYQRVRNIVKNFMVLTLIE